ncbi:ferritin-like domain-containing protein [Chitinophaga arvensicola]|nr:ferritin-like domain-containing protein [Chitinophaga arvensicola]
MYSNKQWIDYFAHNAQQERINWQLPATLTPSERKNILKSLQAWQLGETSDGSHLIRATEIYARKLQDPDYVIPIKQFICEEQKHGNNLGRYLDAIGEKRIKKDWGDTLFRKARYFNSSLEIWTITVLVVESTAQVFYQSLKDATECQLLQQICTDILIDEAAHIRFQVERLAAMLQGKSITARAFRALLYKCCFVFTTSLVWFAHRQLFRAGGNTFSSYLRKMTYKYRKIFRQILPVHTPFTTMAASSPGGS